MGLAGPKVCVGPQREVGQRAPECQAKPFLPLHPGDLNEGVLQSIVSHAHTSKKITSIEKESPHYENLYSAKGKALKPNKLPGAN